MSVSCQKYDVTQTNLKKINQFSQNFKKPETNPESRKHRTRWSEIAYQWIVQYREIAKRERDVRNFNLSEKFSKLGVDWVSKIEDLRTMDTQISVDTLEVWLDEFLVPKPPSKPRYFLGQDAFENISRARDILINSTDRLCQVIEGNPWVNSLANLDYSIDLLKEKKYTKSLYYSNQAITLITRKVNCNDLDHDGVPIPFDQCPLEPEDKDLFEDDDGCPEPGP
ncbi:MAG: hypothetical protein JNK65_02010 [Deltaproteobacteria bacterium]|nr:hypothetical protein [Deltaproteobacteria bacterium]